MATYTCIYWKYIRVRKETVATVSNEVQIYYGTTRQRYYHHGSCHSVNHNVRHIIWKFPALELLPLFSRTKEKPCVSNSTRKCYQHRTCSCCFRSQIILHWYAAATINITWIRMAWPWRLSRHRCLEVINTSFLPSGSRLRAGGDQWVRPPRGGHWETSLAYLLRIG